MTDSTGPASTSDVRGSGHGPRGDIDWVIMSSAGDEDRLPELLAAFRAEYPAIEPADALSRLRSRLGQLLADGKVGIYESMTERSCTGESGYRDLAVAEAVALVGRPDAWEREVPTGSERLCHLFAKDPTFWGQYYGGVERHERGNGDD